MTTPATKPLDESLAGFVDQLTSVTQIVSDKLIKAAPDVSNIILKATQLHAAVDVATGVVGIAIGAFALGKLVPKFVNLVREAGNYDSMEIVGTLSAVATTIVGGLFLLGGILSVFSTSNLIAIFSPEAAIALKAMAFITK